MCAARAPRKFRKGFDKVKCTFCRLARKKCEPEERQWPGEKCDRCLEKNLACSEGQPPKWTTPYARKPAEHASISLTTDTQLMASTIPMAFDSKFRILMPQPSNQSNEASISQELISNNPSIIPYQLENTQCSNYSVLLLSLQAIILMAVEELKTLADSMTGAFRKDSIELSPTTSLPGLNDRFAEFKEFSHCLQEAISMLGASRTLTDAYSVLCNDYCRPDITWDKDEGALRFMGEAISLWQKTGHYGIAYVLQTKRLLQYPELAKSECQRLIRCRELFLTEIGAIMEQFNLNMQAPRSLYGSQLFLPSKLLRIPEIASHFQNTKLPDCLGRSVSHAFSDAGCIVEWPSEHLNHMDLLGRSALYFACRDGGKCLKRLLKSGADYRKPALNGLTPLHVAASMGHENTCKQLWSWICNDTNRVHNYDLHPDSTGRTPFMWAAWSGNEPTLRFFYRKIDQPRRLREGHDSRGRTAVCLAACKGHTHIVKYLLEEGFASDIVDVQGRSPFWYAAQRSHCDILALLAERGAYVDCRDNDGLTPLAEAARQGHEDVISYLLRFNYYDRLTGIEVNPRINIDSKDNLGKSPLILAAEAQKAKCVRLLFEHGPLLLDPDDVRKTSVIARRTGDEDTWNIVRRYMTIFPQYVSV